MRPVKMGAGDLRDRVIVQTNTESTDSQGGRSSSWGALAGQPAIGIAAKVEGLGGSERQQAEAIGSHALYRVTIRYWASVTAKMRLIWTPHFGSAKTLEIAVVDASDREWMTLECGEVG